MLTVRQGPDDQPDTLFVEIDEASLLIGDLIVHRSCSQARPHQLIGLGGSSLLLDDYGLCRVLAGVLRFRIAGPIDFQDDAAGWRFCLENKDVGVGRG